MRTIAETQGSEPPCQVCQVKTGKYLCPKCQKHTCSLTCYKTHSDDCVEQFYQEQVETELRYRKTTPKAERRMQEIVHNLYPEGEDLPVLEEVDESRLNYLLENCEKEDILEELTPREEALFGEYLKSELKDLKPFEPWWESETGPNCDVQDLSDPSLTQYNQLPALSSLTKVPASPVLPYHLLNVIWAIAYTWRRFNGDIDFSAEGMFAHLMRISRALNGSADGHMASVLIAVSTAQEEAFRVDGQVAKDWTYLIQDDVRKIAGKKSVLVQSCGKVMELIAALEAGVSTKKAVKRECRKAKLKICYYLSYLKQCPSGQFFESIQEELSSTLDRRDFEAEIV